VHRHNLLSRLFFLLLTPAAGTARFTGLSAHTLCSSGGTAAVQGTSSYQLKQLVKRLTRWMDCCPPGGLP
jgi:hypothetical protein